VNVEVKLLLLQMRQGLDVAVRAGGEPEIQTIEVASRPNLFSGRLSSTAHSAAHGSLSLTSSALIFRVWYVTGSPKFYSNSTIKLDL
jgi:hypothetical protein